MRERAALVIAILCTLAIVAVLLLPKVHAISAALRGVSAP